MTTVRLLMRDPVVAVPDGDAGSICAQHGWPSFECQAERYAEKRRAEKESAMEQTVYESAVPVVVTTEGVPVINLRAGLVAAQARHAAEAAHRAEFSEADVEAVVRRVDARLATSEDYDRRRFQEAERVALHDQARTLEAALKGIAAREGLNLRDRAGRLEAGRILAAEQPALVRYVFAETDSSGEPPARTRDTDIPANVWLQAQAIAKEMRLPLGWESDPGARSKVVRELRRRNPDAVPVYGSRAA